MPFQRKTLTQLMVDAASDLDASLKGADSLLPVGFLPALAKALPAAVNGLYGYLDYIALNSTPFTAQGEYADAWGALKGVLREAAVAAVRSVTFSNAQPGAPLPAGTLVVRGDGFQYTVQTAGVVAANGVVTVPVIAAVAGAAGNNAAGTVLTLGQAIAGIPSGGVDAGSVTVGADVELDAPYRTRYLRAYAKPPQGGSSDDYVTWALGVAGVTRAWTLRQGAGPGTVVVYVMLDSAEAAFNGFPQGNNGVATGETRVVVPATGDQLEVANALFAVQPVLGVVYVTAPLPNNLTFTISGGAAWSAATKSAVSAAINVVLLASGAPGGIVDNQGNPIGKINVSDIEAAIAAVPGTEGFVITAIAASAGAVTPGSIGNITSNTGCLPVLQTVTYV